MTVRRVRLPGGKRMLIQEPFCTGCDGSRWLQEIEPSLWRIVGFHMPECSITGDPSLVGAKIKNGW